MTAIRRIVSKNLGMLLLDRKVITQEQLDKSLNIQKEQGGLIGQILVMLGFAKEEDIAQALTVQYGFPFLPLRNYEVSLEVLKLIPNNVAVQYNLIGIDKIGTMLTIAMSNPLNVQAIEDVETLTQCQVQVFVSTMSDITEAIQKFYHNTRK
ncbi:MAG: hypothetical protein ABIJ27_04000 [Candidatus Omnitrophota bacterium]